MVHLEAQEIAVRLATTALPTAKDAMSVAVFWSRPTVPILIVGARIVVGGLPVTFWRLAA